MPTPPGGPDAQKVFGAPLPLRADMRHKKQQFVIVRALPTYELQLRTRSENGVSIDFLLKDVRRWSRQFWLNYGLPDSPFVHSGNFKKGVFGEPSLWRTDDHLSITLSGRGNSQTFGQVGYDLQRIGPHLYSAVGAAIQSNVWSQLPDVPFERTREPGRSRKVKPQPVDVLLDEIVPCRAVAELVHDYHDPLRRGRASLVVGHNGYARLHCDTGKRGCWGSAHITFTKAQEIPWLAWQALTRTPEDGGAVASTAWTGGKFWRTRNISHFQMVDAHESLTLSFPQRLLEATWQTPGW